MVKRKTQGCVADLGIFPVFNPMPEDDLKALAAAITIEYIVKGTTIIRHMDKSTDFYLLFEGKLLANQYSMNGREISYRRLNPGVSFGELAAIDGAMRSVTITTLTDVKIGRITAEGFHAQLKTSPSFSLALLKDMASRVRDLSNRIFSLTAVTVPFRIDAELLKMAIESGVHNNTAIITPVPNHSELAASVSAQREAVTREITRLVADGLIAKHTDSLEVLDVDKLIERVEAGGGENLADAE